MRDLLITSDTHFLHGNIVKYCKRPWLQPGDLDDQGEWVSRDIAHRRAKEMTAAMIVEWNAVVKPDDEVIHLGDFCFGVPDQVLRQLNGTIHFVIGSHDKDLVRCLDSGRWKHKIDNWGRMTMINRFGRWMVLSHCAMRVWEKSHYGSINLYGHSHDTLPELPGVLAMDVGVDAAYRLLGQYRPFRVEEIFWIMDKKAQDKV